MGGVGVGVWGGSGRQFKDIPRGERGELQSPIEESDVAGSVEGSGGAYHAGGHDPREARASMTKTDSETSMASTFQGSGLSIAASWLSPIKEVSEGSSQNSSPDKTTIGGDRFSPVGKKAGRNSDAQLMLVDERFGQENLSRGVKLCKDGEKAVLERSLTEVDRNSIKASAGMKQGGGTSGEALEIQEGRGSSQKSDHVYLKDRRGVDVKDLNIGRALFDCEVIQGSPQSSSVSEQWFYKNYKNRHGNSEIFTKDVKTLSKMLIWEVDGKREGVPVVSDIYFNDVLIAEYILPSSDVAGVRKVQSGSVARIVNALDILARHVENLNHHEVPRRELIDNVIHNLESCIGAISNRKKFLKCMLKADASSLRYLIDEVVRGTMDKRIVFWKHWLSDLAFGQGFEKDRFWPDEATRNGISGKEISLEKVNDFLKHGLCEQRHVNWKFWQQALVGYDNEYLQSREEFEKSEDHSFTNFFKSDNERMEGGEQFEGFDRQFEEHRLLLLLLMKEARKSSVTMDQLEKVYSVESERIFNPPEHLGVQWPRGLRELYKINSFSNRFQNIVRGNA